MSYWILIPLAIFVGLPCLFLSTGLFGVILRVIFTGDDGGTEMGKAWVMACIMACPVIAIIYVFLQ